MWPYWVLFLIPAIRAVTHFKMVNGVKTYSVHVIEWQITYIFLVLIIGLRHEVGGDWGNYLALFHNAKDLSLIEVMSNTSGDPASSFINWLAIRFDWGIYFVNFVYSIIFVTGLFAFCRIQPHPWLALTASVPYLITVVAMGYSRQGVATGLVMLALVWLSKKNILFFLLFVILAATFHKSAIILLPLAALSGSTRPIFTFIGVILTVLIMYILLLQDHLDYLILGYLDAEYESSGAFVRIAMNVFPSLFFLVFRKKFGLAVNELIFWTWMSLGSFAFVFLLLISPSSTAVDRLALYWIPLQLFVWSRAPDVLGKSRVIKVIVIYGIIFYYAIVYFIWLAFAIHSNLWLPYKFYPLVLLWI